MCRTEIANKMRECVFKTKVMKISLSISPMGHVASTFYHRPRWPRRAGHIDLARFKPAGGQGPQTPLSCFHEPMSQDIDCLHFD